MALNLLKPVDDENIGAAIEPMDLQGWLYNFFEIDKPFMRRQATRP